MNCSNNCWWFNPRSAEKASIGVIKQAPAVTFTPPATGAGNDRVLVVEAAH
ncbi:putative collagen-binding domain-containing protein [Chitinophaga sp. OAE865]|uniref:putative collagen-binding domain-containing protein n=1 Tax=Chitinophaga sp. OAE865 TaxID=2817898 RepID=UPI001AE3CC69